MSLHRKRKISLSSYAIISSIARTLFRLDLADEEEQIELDNTLYARIRHFQEKENLNKIKSQPWIKENKRKLKYY